MYKKSFVNIVKIGLYFNFLIKFLSSFTWYRFKTDFRKQTAVAYTSIIITFVLLVGVIIYHVSILVKKDQSWEEEVAEYPLASVQPAKLK